MRAAVSSEFLPWLYQAIPLSAHMGIKGLGWQQDTLVADLSLAPLVNDKGTGFGGGVTGFATLLGWCYVTLILDETNQRCPVVVKESSNRFTAPITEDFSMRCWCEDEQGLEAFLKDFAERRRASLNLKIEVHQGDRLAFSYQGNYVALGQR